MAAGHFVRDLEMHRLPQEAPRYLSIHASPFDYGMNTRHTFPPVGLAPLGTSRRMTDPRSVTRMRYRLDESTGSEATRKPKSLSRQPGALTK